MYALSDSWVNIPSKYRTGLKLNMESGFSSYVSDHANVYVFFPDLVIEKKEPSHVSFRTEYSDVNIQCKDL
jgi:hypothetical protein